MKKFYSLMMLMVLMICSAFAQEPIEKVAELSNSKAYTIQTQRCFLQAIVGGSCLYTSTGSASGIATELDATNKNHQFALINGGKNIFLYNVGAGKFIDKTGAFTDSLSADVAINVVEISSTSSAFPINLNWDDSHYLNTQESGNFDTGYLIDDWTDLDAGNEFQIIEAADFTDEAAIAKAVAFDNAIIVDSVKYVYMYNGEQVYTYTNVVKGNAPLTVTYDAPGARLGTSCSDATPDSKVITENTVETVTYNYSLDYSLLPFVPTTVTDGKFAADTKWYYIMPEDTNSFCYTSNADDGFYRDDNNGIRMTDGRYLFAFTGDPFAGYQIFNYTKGATKPVYGVENSASYYSDLNFTEGKTCNFLLEEGNNEGQYRFNKASCSDCYMEAYQGIVNLITWASSATYSYTQYYISEATDTEVEQALTGVLDANPSYASGYSFRNGAAIDTLKIYFTGSADDTSIVIAAGMESGQITLQNANGNVIATPSYSVSAEDPTRLDVVFDPAFNTEGDYVLVMARGVVKGAVSGRPNNETKWKYSFQSTSEQIVTARIWKTMSGYSGYSNWSTLPYTTHDDGVYYTCKVKVLGKDAFVLMDWTGNGTGDTLKVQFDASKTYYNVITFNDAVLDSYASTIIDTHITLDPAGYSSAYFYAGGYSDASFDGSYGMCALNCYNYYDRNYDTYVFADFYMDDRYKFEEVLDGKVHASAFQDLDYDDATYPAFQQLPYDATTGTYDITVGIMGDNEIVLQNYTGANASESLDIVFDPESGDVVSFNGQDVDDYGSSWITSSVIDGKSGGYYAYVGDYSNISYDATTKSGYAIISCYDESTGGYPYIYVSFGNYSPTTAIKSVKTAEETAGNVTIYNIAGQRISAPRKGVNIVNGKKIMY